MKKLDRIEGENVISYFRSVPNHPARVEIFEIGDRFARLSVVNRNSGMIMAEKKIVKPYTANPDDYFFEADLASIEGCLRNGINRRWFKDKGYEIAA